MTSKTILTCAALAMTGALLSGCSQHQAKMQPAAYDHFQRHPLGATGKCPLASDDMKINSLNEASPSFGCSIQRTITAMVADPADLERPRAVTPADQNRRQYVLTRYQTGEDTASESRAEGTNSLIE